MPNPFRLLRSYHLQPRQAPVKLPPGYHSLLPLVLSSSNLLLPQGQRKSLIYSRTADGTTADGEPAVPFFLSEPAASDRRPIGFLRPEVRKALEDDHRKHSDTGVKSPWSLHYSHEELESVSFAPWVNQGGKYSRTMHMERLVVDWKKDGLFTDILRGWSNEPYPVYHHAPPILAPPTDPVAFAIERAALPLFGFANFGCLLTAYIHERETGKTMLWIPRRSMAKRTWPGKLDVTVGGGISLGDTALSTIVRECSEEASLDATYVRENVRPVGVLPFPNRSPARWILPGMYHLFDLPLPSDGSVCPRTNAVDGEVESFELMDVDAVLHNLLDGKFKASSALAIVDFLIRHGFVTEESDSRYVDVCRSLKGDIILPVPWL